MKNTLENRERNRMRFLSFTIISNGTKQTAIINMSQIESICPTKEEDQFLFKMCSGDSLIIEMSWHKLTRLYNLRADIKQYV